MAAVASPKAAHYQSAITSALSRGAWAETNPGSAPNGTELSWGELIRKWGKHTGGSTSTLQLADKEEKEDDVADHTQTRH
jgi:hypothetical protein